MTVRVIPLRNTGGRPVPASIQTAARDARIRAILDNYVQVQRLRSTIRVQRTIIWGLVAIIGATVMVMA